MIKKVLLLSKTCPHAFYIYCLCFRKSVISLLYVQKCVHVISKCRTNQVKGAIYKKRKCFVQFCRLHDSKMADDSRDIQVLRDAASQNALLDEISRDIFHESSTIAFIHHYFW